MAPNTFTHRLIHKLSSSNLLSSPSRPTTRHIDWAANTLEPQSTAEDSVKRDRAKDAQAYEFNLLKQDGFDFRPSDTLAWTHDVSDAALSGWGQRPLAKSSADSGKSFARLESYEPTVAVDVPHQKASLPSEVDHPGIKHNVADAPMHIVQPHVTVLTALHSNPNPYYRGALKASHTATAAKPQRHGARLGGRRVRPTVRSPPPPKSTRVALSQYRLGTYAEQNTSDSQLSLLASAEHQHVQDTSDGAAESSTSHSECSSALHSPGPLSPFTFSASRTGPSAIGSEQASALNLSSADFMAMRNLSTRVQRRRNSTIKISKEDSEVDAGMLEPDARGFHFSPQGTAFRKSLATERSHRSERIEEHVSDDDQHGRPRSITASRQPAPAWAPALNLVNDDCPSSAGLDNDSDSTLSDVTLTQAVVDWTGEHATMQEEFVGIYEAIAMCMSRYSCEEIRVVDVAGGARHSY